MLKEYDSEASSSEVKRDLKKIKASITKLSERVWPRENTIQPHLYGSRKTGLAKEGSDADFYLDIGMIIIYIVTTKRRITELLFGKIG